MDPLNQSVTPVDENGVLRPTPESVAELAGRSRPVLPAPYSKGTVDEEGPSAWDVAAATWRRETLLGQMMTNQGFRPDQDDEENYTPGWNPYSYFARNKEEYADIEKHVLAGRFDDIHSQEGFDRLVAALRRSEEDLKTIQGGGVLGFVAGMGASLLDVTTLLPVGGLSKVAQASRLAAAVRGAGAVGAAVGVQELGLRQFDPARTVEESLLNVAGGSLLGAGVGAFLGKTAYPGSRLHPDHPENPLNVRANPTTSEIVVNRIGQTPEEGLTIKRDSIGAARVSDLDLDKATPDGTIAAKVQSLGDAAFQHFTPLARMWSYLPRGREIMLRMLDHGGVITRGMGEGRTMGLSVEDYANLFQQRTRDTVEDLYQIFRSANMDMGQSGLGTTLRTELTGLTLDRVDLNRVTKSDFMTAVREALAAERHEANGLAGQKNQAYMDGLRRFKGRGLNDDQAQAIMGRVREAAERVKRYWNETGKEAVQTGLLDESKWLKDGYGHPIMWVRSAIQENPNKFRDIITRYLVETPDEAWLRESHAIGLDEFAALDDARKADILRDWRGDVETAAAAQARAGLESALAQLQRSEDMLETILGGQKLVGQELKKRGLQRLRAEVRERMTRWFAKRVNHAAKNYAVIAGRQEELETALADLGTIRARNEAQALGAQLDDMGPRIPMREADLADAQEAQALAKLDRDAARDARKAAETDLRSLVKLIDSVEDNLTQETRLQLALLRKNEIEPRLVPEALEDLSKLEQVQAAVDNLEKYRIEARDVLKLAREFERIVGADLRQAQSNTAKARAYLDKLVGEFEATAKQLRVRNEEVEKVVKTADRLAGERAKGGKVMDDLAEDADGVWQDALARLSEAEQAYRWAADNYRTLRKAGAISRQELRAARKDYTKARRLAAKTAKATPLETYLDQLVRNLSAGVEAPSGLLIDKVGESGRFIERKFKLPPKIERELMEAGYLESDLVAMLDKYQADVGGRIALKRVFGDDDREAIIKRVEDDYLDAIRKLEGQGRTKDAEALNRLRQKNVEDVRAVWDRVLNRTNMGGEDDSPIVWMAEKVRQMGYVAFGGGFIFSAMADIGTAQLASTGFFRNLVKSAKDYQKLIDRALKDDPDAVELKTILASMETGSHLGVSTNAFGAGSPRFDLGFGTGRTRQFTASVDKFMRMAGDKVGVFSGLHSWSNFVRRTAGLTQLANVSRWVKDYDALPPARKAELGALGIGEAEAKGLAQLMRKHGREVDGLFDPGVSKWLDEPNGEYLKDVLSAALVRTQKRASFVPGYGSTPLAMNKWYGALLLQFQSFAFQFTQSFLLAGAQRMWTYGDLRFMTAMATSLAAAVVISAGRAAIRGEDTGTWSEAKWANEIITRSGFLGWTQPYVDASVKLLGNKVNEFVGAEVFVPSTKFARNSVLDSFLGPWAGMVKSMGTSIGAVADGDLDKFADEASRFIPLNQQFKALKALSEGTFDE